LSGLTATSIKPCQFFVPADMLTFTTDRTPAKHELQIVKAASRLNEVQKKSKATALDIILPPVRGAAKSCAGG